MRLSLVRMRIYTSSDKVPCLEYIPNKTVELKKNFSSVTIFYIAGK